MKGSLHSRLFDAQNTENCEEEKPNTNRGGLSKIPAMLITERNIPQLQKHMESL
jgi:hypothetical protein